MKSWLSLFVLAASAAACQCNQGVNNVGTDAGDGGSTSDAGSMGDSGSPGPDAGNLPDGGSGKIEHLVIVVLENHTFDNLFANFPGAHSVSQFPIPDGGGSVLTAAPCPDVMPIDPCHAHSCALTDWDNGRMDGWFSEPEGAPDAGRLPWCQYQQSQVPGLWDLASNYGLADNYFSSVLAPSFPGHMVLLAAQAGWATDNPSQLIPWGCDDGSSSLVSILPPPDAGTCAPSAVFPCFNIPSGPDLLAPGMTWKFYGTDTVIWGIWSMFDAIKPIRQGPGWTNVVAYNPDFDNDAKNGTLPNVAWLVDQDAYSGHPEPPPLSFSMCKSVTWITEHVNEVINGPQWSTSAVIITWDDFGGFVDDVSPPTSALYGCDATNPYGPGFRLPAIIVSPWVKKGVFHGFTEQASIVRLIEELFSASKQPGQLHAMDPAARDDVAGSLLDAFDFNQTPLPAVPAATQCP
jgi:phospholipase C